MMKNFFSSYINPLEGEVDKFFVSLKEDQIHFLNKRKLLSLMQSNLVVVNMWLEKKYKAYKFLNKKNRGDAYKNLDIIVDVFKNDYLKIDFAKEDFSKIILQQSKDYNLKKTNLKQLEKLKSSKKFLYLYAVMKFLKPGRFYKYQKTSSFWKLFANIKNKEKMIGDCNQILTFYVYLYSLKFNLSDLKIKILPGHVCLHFNGVDIETTAGKICVYQKYDALLPITDLVSVNLLDTSDFREAKKSVTSRLILERARICYSISSNRGIVNKNLESAFHNLAIELMKANDFDGALFFTNKMRGDELTKKVWQNAAVYYMNKYSFSKSLYYANKLNDLKLLKMIRFNEGIYFYKNNSFDKAVKIFRELNNKEMEKACLGGIYNRLLKEVKYVKTIKQAKEHRYTYEKMYKLAAEMNDSSLQKGIETTLNQIRSY